MPPAHPPALTPVAPQLRVPVAAGAPEGTPSTAAVLTPLLPHPAHSFQLFQHTESSSAPPLISLFLHHSSSRSPRKLQELQSLGDSFLPQTGVSLTHKLTS